MSEHLKPAPEDQARVSEEALRAATTAIFEKMGVPADDAALGADVLVMSDLRGVESHGVSNMLRAYVEAYRSGAYNPQPHWTITRESPATAVIDGDNGLGIIQAPKAMRLAMDKAAVVGVGAVSVYRSHHAGAVGHHALIAVEADMVGLCFTSPSPAVAPTFGAEARLGTNPIAMAAPAAKHPPVIFDVATSTIPLNKVHLAHRTGAPLLGGWVAERDGAPIMTPSAAKPDGAYHLLPLGATRDMGSHKGYGLAFLVETFTTMLAGVRPYGLEPETGYKHFFAAYRIDAFCDVDVFKAHMDETIDWLEATKPAPGCARVLYPGRLEDEVLRARRAHGVPLHKEVVGWFRSIAAELGLTPIETL